MGTAIIRREKIEAKDEVREKIMEKRGRKPKANTAGGLKNEEQPLTKIVVSVPLPHDTDMT
jgi:hypothetical protein